MTRCGKWSLLRSCTSWRPQEKRLLSDYETHAGWKRTKEGVCHSNMMEVNIEVEVAHELH